MEGENVLQTLNNLYCDGEGRPYQDVRILHTYVLDDPFDDPAPVHLWLYTFDYTPLIIYLWLHTFDYTPLIIYPSPTQITFWHFFFFCLIPPLWCLLCRLSVPNLPHSYYYSYFFLSQIINRHSCSISYLRSHRNESGQRKRWSSSVYHTLIQAQLMKWTVAQVLSPFSPYIYTLYTPIHHYTPLYTPIHHYTPLYTPIHHNT